MNVNPLISVIVPTYKRPGMLGRALDSLLAQTYENLEILVVDDNPPESSGREETRRFMERYKTEACISYIEREENGGGALARNTGIESSHGEYIAFLDDDDEYLPGKIEAQLKLFERSTVPDLGLVYCRTLYVDGKGQAIYEGCPCVRGNALAYHVKGTLGSTGSFLFKRKAILDAGMFEDIPAAQEYILVYKILKKGYQVDFENHVLFRMYLHDFGRITTGPGKIEGEKKGFAMIQEDVRSLLSLEEQKMVFYNYSYNMFFLYLKEKNSKEWRHHLKKAFKIHWKNKKNLLMILAVFIGFDNFVSLKMKTKKILTAKNSS